MVSTRRPGGRTAATRQRILGAGLEALADTPPRVSYDRLAMLAGVNKTTLYRNWPDPATLVAEALDAETTIPAPIGGTDLRARLRGLAVDARVFFETARTRFVVATTLALAQHEPRVADAFDRYWNRRFARIADEDPAARVAAETLAAQLMFHTLVRRVPITDAAIERWVEVALAAV